jgi:hypothetical protein
MCKASTQSCGYVLCHMVAMFCLLRAAAGMLFLPCPSDLQAVDPARFATSRFSRNGQIPRGFDNTQTRWRKIFTLR